MRWIGCLRRVLCALLLAHAWGQPSAAIALCGDGILESPGELCDDGNNEEGDCCAADCTAEPQGTPCDLGDPCLRAGSAKCDGSGQCVLGNAMFCFGSAKADLFDPGDAESQRFKLRGGYPQDTDNLGDPTAGTQYTLCIYNYHHTGPLTVDYRLTLPTGEGWEATSSGFAYRRPRGAATPVKSARLSAKLRTSEFLGPYYRTRVRFSSGGPSLALPGPVAASHYFDVDEGISSACVVNDRGLMVGVSTWRIAKNPSLINAPDHVHWEPPRFPSRD